MSKIQYNAKQARITERNGLMIQGRAAIAAAARAPSHYALQCFAVAACAFVLTFFLFS